MANISHKALFDKLRDTTVIERAVQYAHWTLPQLMADFTATQGRRVCLERDYQEVGALLTNHLSSKLARILFPTTTPFFKIKPSVEFVRATIEEGATEIDLNSGLARLEMDATQQLFLNSSYAQLIHAIKHLIVTGNVLLYRDQKEQKSVAYGLQSYVVRRDGMGEMVDCVLRECTYVEALPWDVQEILRSKDKAKYSRPEQYVEVYTRIHRVYVQGRQVYEVSQEVDVTPVGEVSTYPKHLCPWSAPTWSLVIGEHYGRGLVEDYAGGFAKISDLSEAAALYGIEIMRVVHLVSAGSGTDIDDLMNAEHGEYVRGDPNTVNAHESGDAGKLLQVANEIATVFARLAKAFMYEANTRNAERVTAYELQRDAQEAENALGGVYSSLAASMQVPLAHIALTEINSSILPGLISKELKLSIVAGIPALGRSSDVQNLLAATQEAAAIVPALVQVDNRIDPRKVMDLVMAGRSVDVSMIHKDKATMEAEARASQQAAVGEQQMMQAADLADQANQLQQLQQ